MRKAPYPEAFRDDVVRVAMNREPGVTIEHIAKDFGVHPITLTKWMRNAETGESITLGQTHGETVKNRELRKRMVKAQQSWEHLIAGEAWQNPRGLVFTDALGAPLVPANVSKTFGQMAERAGLPPVVFQSLRHLATTIMLQNGLPLPVVSRILGHSTVTVTADLYLDVVKNRKLADDVTAAYARAFSA